MIVIGVFSSCPASSRNSCWARKAYSSRSSMPLKVAAISLTSSEPVIRIRSVRSVCEICSAVARNCRNGRSNRPATSQPTTPTTPSESSETRANRLVMSLICLALRSRLWAIT